MMLRSELLEAVLEAAMVQAADRSGSLLQV
jgi:hypothetical protein